MSSQAEADKQPIPVFKASKFILCPEIYTRITKKLPNVVAGFNSCYTAGQYPVLNTSVWAKLPQQHFNAPLYYNHCRKVCASDYITPAAVADLINMTRS